MADARRDQNFVTTLLGVSNVDQSTPVVIWADPTTHRLLVDASGSIISSSMQTDVFTASNGQSTFTASQTVAYTFGFYISGVFQTPGNDYAVGAGVATLDNLRYPGGVPQGTEVVWVYSIT